MIPDSFGAENQKDSRQTDEGFERITQWGSKSIMKKNIIYNSCLLNSLKI